MKKPPLQDVIVMHPHARTHHTPLQEIAQSAPRERYTDIRREPRTVRPVERFEEQTEEQVPPRRLRHETPPPSEKRGKSNASLWPLVALGIGSLVVVTAFVLSLMFAGATVTVHPKQDTILTNTTLRAGVGQESGDIQVALTSIEKTAVEQVIAQSETQVEERAFGKITIYNNYAKTPQRLIKNTRFQSDDGKIYKIRESIEIPGYTTEGVPGELEVTVYAEEPREEYNRGPGDFTIPGFKDYPQEGKIYATSKEGMQGGFLGVKRVVLEADRKRALEQLEVRLRDELLSALTDSSNATEGAHMFRDAVFFEFAELPDESVEDDKVLLSLSGKIHALVFSDDYLAEALARKSIASYAGSPIRISNISELSISASVPVDTTSSSTPTTILPWESSIFTVTVSGKSKFIWEFDENTLRTDLVSIEKDALEGGLQPDLQSKHPGIDRLSVVNRPFWKRNLPESPDDIQIITKLDE
jgi:hypothetical protein